MRRAEIVTFSFVTGWIENRRFRRLVRKAPNPRMEMVSPRAKLFSTVEEKASIKAFAWAAVISSRVANAAANSLFVTPFPPYRWGAKRGLVS